MVVRRIPAGRAKVKKERASGGGRGSSGEVLGGGGCRCGGRGLCVQRGMHAEERGMNQYSVQFKEDGTERGHRVPAESSRCYVTLPPSGALVGIGRDGWMVGWSCALISASRCWGMVGTFQ